MKTIKLASKAAYALGAVRTYLAPRLAQDAQVELAPIFDGVTAKNFSEKRPGIESRIKAAVRRSLAQDADVDDLVDLLDRLEDDKVEDDMVMNPNDAPPLAMKADEDGPSEMCARVKDFLKDKVDPEVLAQLDTLMADPAGGTTGVDEEDEEMKKKREAEEAAKTAAGAQDDPPDFLGKPETKKAMDAMVKLAVDGAVKTAVSRAVANQQGIREAERFVRPWVGDLAMDGAASAEEVYGVALQALGVKTDGVHPSALRTILEREPKPGERTGRKLIAADTATEAAGFAKRHPAAARIQLS